MVAKKADSLYKTVSAASIVAKVRVTSRRTSSISGGGGGGGVIVFALAGTYYQSPENFCRQPVVERFPCQQ